SVGCNCCLLHGIPSLLRRQYYIRAPRRATATLSDPRAALAARGFIVSGRRHMLNGRVSGGLVRIGLFVVLFTVLSILLAGVLASAGISLEGRQRLLATVIALLAAVVVGAALLHWLDDRPAGALGCLRQATVGGMLGLGTVIGVAGLTTAAVVRLALGKLGDGPVDGSVGTWVAVVAGDFAIFLIAAASEAAMFRGYPLQ